MFLLRLDLQDLLWDLHIRWRCHQWACFAWATCLVLALVKTELKGPSILDLFPVLGIELGNTVEVSGVHPSPGLFEYASAGVY